MPGKTAHKPGDRGVLRRLLSELFREAVADGNSRVHQTVRARCIKRYAPEDGCYLSSVVRSVLNWIAVRQAWSIVLVLMLSLSSPLRLCAPCDGMRGGNCASGNQAAMGHNSQQRCDASVQGADDCCAPAFGSASGKGCQTLSADPFVAGAPQSVEAPVAAIALLPHAGIFPLRASFHRFNVSSRALSPPVPLFLSLNSILI